MPENKKYYIAYGSNLNIRQMRYRCPDAVPFGVADLDGWQLLFKGSKTGSYLTIERKANSRVPVAVWKVSERDEANLDRYEGCPTFYYKKEIKLPVESFQTGKLVNIKAFVYIMHEDRPFGIPNDFYVRTCAEGYHDFGFDYMPLVNAYELSKEECKE